MLKRPADIVTEIILKFIIEIVSFIGEYSTFYRHRDIVWKFIVWILFLFYCDRNRRTNGDTLELSEVSLDLNLIDNWIRYKFTDAPILSVSIAEHNDKVIVLVATVSSIHTLKFAHPNRFQKNQDETQSFSVFHGACTGQTSRDPAASFLHVINQSTAPSK